MSVKNILRVVLLCLFFIIIGHSSVLALSDQELEQMTDQLRIDKALPKAIVGTSIFCVGELLSWTILYPKDKALEDKLFDTLDENTGRIYTMAERAEDLRDESLQLTLLGLPFSAMRIAGVTVACINATKSNASTKRMLAKRNLVNPVWAPYISGWALGAIGGMAGFVSGVTQSRGPLKFARVMSVCQSTLWGVSGILSITTCARNKSMLESKDTTGWRITPILDDHCYGMNFDWKF